MSLDVGDLVAKVSVDDSQFKRGLSKSEKDFKQFGKKLKGYAKIAGAAIAVGLFVGIKGAIEKASDLHETVSKVKEIFEESSQAILDFSKTSAEALGMSQQEALDAASTFAVFGKSAGLAGKPLVTFSTNLTGLAADLASFYNTSPEDAIIAIGAALRGEMEPIRRYGVLLDDASLRQQAFAMHLTNTTKKVLTPQQRVLAAQALIFKQTGDAQGDFARTSDGLANSTKILKARLTDLQAHAGEVLLPTMLKIIKAFESFLDFTQRNKDVMVPLIVVLGSLAAIIYGITLAMKGWIAVQWLLNAAMDANPIGAVILAIMLLVAGIIILWKRSETFRKIVKATWAGIKTAVSATVNWLTNTAWPAIKAVWNAIAGAVMWLWHSVLEPFGHGVGVVVGVIVRIFVSLYNLIKFLVTPGIVTAFTLISNNVKVLGAVFGWLWSNVVKPLFELMGAEIEWLWTHAGRPIFGLMASQLKWFGGIVETVFGKIGGFMKKAWMIGIDMAKFALNEIITVLNQSLSAVNYLIKGVNKVPGVDFPTIPLIPHLAGGGTVAPRPGGTPVVMGDGGQVEYGIPKSDMRQIIGQAVRAGGGNGQITLIIRGDGLLRGLRETVRVQGGSVQTVLAGR